jgi:hypothetical protein
MIPGFVYLYKNRKDWFWTILSVLLLFVWIFSSWECWWYAASFGSRAMVDLYPLLALPLGFGIAYLGKRKITSFLMMVFVFFTFALSLFQSHQFSIGYLHPDRMTKEHYWYIFGKLSIPNYQMYRLEIDRSNTNWVEELKASKIHVGEIEEVNFCQVKHVNAPEKTSALIEKRPYYPKLKTDETLFEAQVIYQTNDSLNLATIHFESFSKFNVYSWNEYSLITQKSVGSVDTLLVKFNLPRINHRADKIQVYVVNSGTKKLTIQSLKIKAFSLIRE